MLAPDTGNPQRNEGKGTDGWAGLSLSQASPSRVSRATAIRVNVALRDDALVFQGGGTNTYQGATVRAARPALSMASEKRRRRGRLDAGDVLKGGGQGVLDWGAGRRPESEVWDRGE